MHGIIAYHGKTPGGMCFSLSHMPLHLGLYYSHDWDVTRRVHGDHLVHSDGARDGSCPSHMGLYWFRIEGIDVSYA